MHVGGEDGTGRPLHPHDDPRPRGHRGRSGTAVQAAVAHGVHGVGHACQAARIVIDEDHGAADRGPFGDRPLQLAPRVRVQPGPGLVEHEQLRLGEQGLRHRHLLTAALGQPGEPRVGVPGGPQPLQPVPGGTGRRPAGQAVDGTEVGEVLGGGEGQGGREAFGDVGGARAAGDPALGGGVDPGEQAQQGRLAGAVGALDADEGAGRHAQLDPAQHPRTAQTVAAAHTVQP